MSGPESRSPIDTFVAANPAVTHSSPTQNTLGTYSLPIQDPFAAQWTPKGNSKPSGYGLGHYWSGAGQWLGGSWVSGRWRTTVDTTATSADLQAPTAIFQQVSLKLGSRLEEEPEPAAMPTLPGMPENSGRVPQNRRFGYSAIWASAQ